MPKRKKIGFERRVIIRDLNEPEYRVIKPFPIRLQRSSFRGEWMASLWDDEIGLQEFPQKLLREYPIVAMSGSTRKEAIDAMKSVILSMYDHVMSVPDEKLGPIVLQQKRFFERFITKEG